MDQEEMLVHQAVTVVVEIVIHILASKILIITKLLQYSDDQRKACTTTPLLTPMALPLLDNLLCTNHLPTLLRSRIRNSKGHLNNLRLFSCHEVYLCPLPCP
jgi:hypothetical protein